MTDPDDRSLPKLAGEAPDRSLRPSSAETETAADPETVRRLEAAMRSMSPTTRKIFMAYRLDGYGYGHIASVTQLSVRDVERHIATAVLAVHRHLSGNERSRWRRWWSRMRSHFC